MKTPESVNDATLFHATDDWGRVTVRRTAEGLILELGSAVEQTRVLPHSPQHLCFEYMRMMQLGLLWRPKPQRVLILGLGGGAQARTLLARFPEVVIDAVELRQIVVDAAYQALFLPRDARLQVHVMDALAFVHQARAQTYDLILVDLFDAQGMAPLLGELAFMQRCGELLTAHSVLAANLWRHPQGEFLLAAANMDKVFPWLGFLAARDRMQKVAFGAQQAPRHAQDIDRLANKHDAELSAYWRELRQQNPALFKR